MQLNANDDVWLTGAAEKNRMCNVDILMRDIAKLEENCFKKQYEKA